MTTRAPKTFEPLHTTKRAIKSAVKSAIYPLYERRLLQQLDFSQTPHHIGLMLDGNRRWSKANPSETGDTSPARGHRAGASKIVALLDWCEEAQVKVVTLWLLSNQNLHRPAEELAPLLDIIGEAVEDLGRRRRWEIRPVGSMELLPQDLQNRLNSVAAATKGIKGVMVNVAIGYGGRREIVDAVRDYIKAGVEGKKSADEIAEDLTISEIDKHLYTKGMPDPELVIRTSGEQRLSGFLLWQSAHSEFYFCEAYWPDFRRVDFLRALRAYAQRHRRFGI